MPRGVQPHWPDGRWKQTTPEWRFLSKLVVGDGCWDWIGAMGKHRYPVFRGRDGRTERAHRFAYEYAVGPIPSAFQIHHLCGNLRCLRPDHLQALSSRDHNAITPCISTLKRARTHCPQGHPYSGDNLMILKHGHRRCRQCARAEGLAWYHRHKNDEPNRPKRSHHGVGY